MISRTTHAPQPMGNPGTIGRFEIHKISRRPMSATAPVTVAPNALMLSFSRQPEPRSRTQWRTIPDWENVIAANTLRAWSGSRAPVDPPKTMISSAQHAEQQDPVRKAQPVAPERELVRRVVVGGSPRKSSGRSPKAAEADSA